MSELLFFSVGLVPFIFIHQESRWKYFMEREKCWQLSWRTKQFFWNLYCHPESQHMMNGDVWSSTEISCQTQRSVLNQRDLSRTTSLYSFWPSEFSELQTVWASLSRTRWPSFVMVRRILLEFASFQVTEDHTAFLSLVYITRLLSSCSRTLIPPSLAVLECQLGDHL